MPFEILETLSLPGDPAKANEDAVLAEPFAAMVFDGATMVSEPLLPGRSDAAWVATFGARRLLAHLKDGDAPRLALRHALADAERSFEGLRRRAPQHRYEMPCASMMLAVPDDNGFDALWYGDCAALLKRPGEPAEVIGIAFDQRASESATAARFLEEKGLAPVVALKGGEHLASFQASRSKVNMPGGPWLFAAYPAASEHVTRARFEGPTGTLVLIASDGFLALATDYRLYDVDGLIASAEASGLKALGDELRAVENGDPEGRAYPRFKKSDDATAVLLRLV